MVKVHGFYRFNLQWSSLYADLDACRNTCIQSFAYLNCLVEMVDCLNVVVVNAGILSWNITSGCVLCKGYTTRTRGLTAELVS